ncbi:MAG: hypothetical protein WCS62_06090, partial [Bacilli bacterium]
MSPGFGGIVFQNGEAAGEMDLFWILISCCNSTIYRFFCLRLVKFLSEKLSQKSTFTGKINPLNFLKSLFSFQSCQSDIFSRCSKEERYASL